MKTLVLTFGIIAILAAIIGIGQLLTINQGNSICTKSVYDNSSIRGQRRLLANCEKIEG